ncbi:MAG: hypothetical protein ABR886_01335 [Dehalococcoidales bacterium]
MFEKKERMKYAKSMRTLEIGVWGHRPGCFFAIHLTTRQGDDMSDKRFKTDLRKLVMWIRKISGVKVEYAGALGYSPGNHLLHFHGLLRFKGFMKMQITRRMLGDKWNEIHGAFVVKMDGVRTMKDLEKYILQHIMKDYVAGGMGEKFVVESKGWRRKIPEDMIKAFKEWYIKIDDSPWLDKDGYRCLNEVVKLYCMRKEAVVEYKSEYFKVSRRGKYWNGIITSEGEYV